MMTFDAVVIGAGAAGLIAPRSPGNAACGAADRPRRKGGGEDPHFRRRALQLHQSRRRRRRTSSRQTRTSAARRWPATRHGLHRAGGAAPHRLSREAHRASCSATARPQRHHRDAAGANATQAASSAGSPARGAADREGRRPASTLETDAGPRGDAPALVVATGGLSIPKIGATDFGYRIAPPVRPALVEPRPALVPLTFAGEPGRPSRSWPACRCRSR